LYKKNKLFTDKVITATPQLNLDRCRVSNVAPAGKLRAKILITR